MNAMKPSIAFAGLLLALAACTTAAPVSPSGPSRPVGVGAEGLGYDHTLARSRYDVGAAPGREVEGPYSRTIGSRGVFMVDTVTGAALAVPTRSYPPIPKGAPVFPLPRPLTENPAEHSAMVRAYLVGAGIPDAQVSGVHVTTTMTGSGPVKGAVQPTRSRLLWYTSHLARAVGGIPVEGSFAFAAFDSERRVITEGVYWPGIPTDVIWRAQDLKRRLGSENDRAPFVARLRALRPDVGDTPGEVQIVHTSAGHHGAFEARAVYSVVARSPGGGKARILRFDETGALVTLPDERPTGTDSPKRASP